MENVALMESQNFTPIEILLIANRGEIARRIQRTAQQMGIKTVAVYAQADLNSLFVKEADFAVALTGVSPSETYLDMNQILEACRVTGANAVHPGYGFLSENAEFAKKVSDEGLIWVGPSPDVIEKMSCKLSAKALMRASQVPVLNGLEISGEIDHQKISDEIGYPLLIKAAAGGGGKGMRIVHTPDMLAESIESARREAEAAFGDGTVFLEKWLTSTRHVEIQVLGDKYGNLLYCFERECSIQRRHQKVIEEAPSPVLSKELRERMGEAAVSAAKAMGYSSAGTFEFLVSGDEFYFLEVNTRLQVEHPVTEEITGLDLVREQLRIAEGESLGFSQEDLGITGHAIEARLYAEDPENNFLPSPGQIAVWEPAEIEGVRYDTGVASGSEIGIDFDPMIAKVIAHGKTRREAARKLALALEKTKLQGLVTNRDFLIETLRSQEFLLGNTTTDFIERVAPTPSYGLSAAATEKGLIAAAMFSRAKRKTQAKVLKTIPQGWRNSKMPPQERKYIVRGVEHSLSYLRLQNGDIEFRIADRSYLVREVSCDGKLVDILIGSERLQFSIEESASALFIHSSLGAMDIKQIPRFPQSLNELKEGDMIAPMPSLVQRINVQAGEQVTKGQVMLTLESMKMELKVSAPRDGVISEIHVKKGRHVDNGQILVSLE